MVMYKKLVTFLVFSLYAPLAAFSADDPSRARLYIPASTNAEVSGCVTCEIKASGYSAGYVRGDGFGIGLASSKVTVTGGSDFYYDSGPMIDLSKTWGSNFTFTFGYGLGISKPTTDYKPNEYWELKGKSSTIFSLGLGYSFGIYEILVKASNVDVTYDAYYQGRKSTESDPSWNTSDIGIGIGFTF